MSEVGKKEALTTADLAAATRSAGVRPGPGPGRAREYEEEPIPEEAAPIPSRPPGDVKAAPPPAPHSVGAPAGNVEEEGHPLFPDEETRRFRDEWNAIQIGFVDEPRKSVEKADGLVANVIQRLAASFSEEKERLVGQWDRGEDVSTEDLRVNLRRYRSFFDRLLNV